MLAISCLIYMWCSMLKRHAHRDTSWQSLDYLKLVERAAFHRQIGFKILQIFKGKNKNGWRLVISPMSGSNNFETSDFADLRFSLWSNVGAPPSPTVSYGVNYCRTLNKWFCVILPKGVAFPSFWLEKNQRANSWEKKLIGYTN